MSLSKKKHQDTFNLVANGSLTLVLNLNMLIASDSIVKMARELNFFQKAYRYTEEGFDDVIILPSEEFTEEPKVIC